MKKSILAILATVSIGATGLEAGNAHAAENPGQNHCSTPQQLQNNKAQGQQGMQQNQQPSQVNYQTSQKSLNHSKNTATTQSSSNQNATSNSTSSQDNSSSDSSSSTNSSSSSESTSEVYQEFIEAGGTQELWEKIVLPESGGNPNASNGQYHGLGQTNQSWGYGSVATQTKGMINYAKERYGSIEAAISFREANGYW